MSGSRGRQPTIGKALSPVHVLDNPVWWALTGPQLGLGASTPLAARFDPEVSPFGGFSAPPTGDHWRDMASLVGPRGMVSITGPGTGPPGDPRRGEEPPKGWRVILALEGVQMVADRPAPRVDPAAGAGLADGSPVPLGLGDVPDMLDLVAVAQPGPFLSRTVEFGGYLGIRREGRLVAMAGERLQPPGYVEISAVATHPDHRGSGLAGRLVGAVMAAAQERGTVPFLHVASDNTTAIRLYRQLGFVPRREVSFRVLRHSARR